MATIEVKDGKPLTTTGQLSMPATFIPSFRAHYAVQQKTQNNFLFYVTGGLGDAICVEPTIRYAMRNFKNAEFSVATWWPEVFKHLEFKQVINFFENRAPSESYYNTHYTFKTLFDGDELHSEFVPHFFTHAIDYHSISMLRMQLTPADKRVVLQGAPSMHSKMHHELLVHPGRSWQSKTIPAEYWNKVLKGLRNQGFVPTIIGATTKDPKLGTVDVNTEGCIDLRNKLSISESIELCQQAKVVLTNDSSPVHMAASGDAWIGMFSTAKRPDLISHYRGPKNECGWKQENLTAGGLWDTLNLNPNNSKEFNFSVVDQKLLESWLLGPEKIVSWVTSRWDD